MEYADRKLIDDLVGAIADSGQTVLDSTHERRLKQLGKKSNAHIEFIFECFWENLKRQHAQVRLSMLNIAQVLFVRSQRFRALLAVRLQAFLDMVIGRPQIPLPLPHAHALQMRKLAVRLVHQWAAKYRHKYKALGLAESFVRHTLKLKPESGQENEQAETLMPTPAERREAHAKRRRERTRQILRGRFLRLVSLADDFQVEVEAAVAACRSSLAIYAEARDVAHAQALADQRAHRAAADLAKQSRATADLERLYFERVNRGHPDDQSEYSYYDDDDDDDDDDAGREVGGQAAGEAREEAAGEARVEAAGEARVEARVEAAGERKELEVEVDDVIRTALLDAVGTVSRHLLPQATRWIAISGKVHFSPGHPRLADKARMMRLLLPLKQAMQEVVAKAEALGVVVSTGQGRTHVQEADTAEVALMSSDSSEEADTRLMFATVAPVDERGRRVRPGDPASGRAPPAAATRTSTAAADDEDGPQPYVPYFMRPRAEQEQMAAKVQAEAEQEEADTTLDDLRRRAPVVPAGSSFLDHWGKDTVPANLTGLEHLKWWGPGLNDDAAVSVDKVDTMSKMVTYVEPSLPPPKWECRAPLRNGKGLCPRRDRVSCPYHGRIIARDRVGAPQNMDAEARARYAAELKARHEATQAREAKAKRKRKRRRKRSNLIPIDRKRQRRLNVKERLARKLLSPQVMRLSAQVHERQRDIARRNKRQ